MEVSNEREELSQNVNAAMMNKNVVMKATNIARGGDVRQAQAIMKGYRRQAAKKMAPQMKQAMLNDFSEQVQDVYGALNDAADSEGEEELDQVVEMQRSVQ